MRGGETRPPGSVRTLGRAADRPLIAVVADDEDIGFALSRVLAEHAPASGRVVTVDWVEVQAA